MDTTIVRSLNTFASGHDWFEDPLRLYVLSSQYLFAALVIGLTLVALLRGTSLRRSSGVLAGVSAAAALLIGALLSAAVDRPRPFVTHHSIHDFLAHAADPGMPSDHATAAFAIGTAILLAHRRTGIIILIAATVLSLGRVMLGVHYLSDVVVGAAIGTISAIIVSRLAGRRPTAPGSSPSDGGKFQDEMSAGSRSDRDVATAGAGLEVQRRLTVTVPEATPDRR